MNAARGNLVVVGTKPQGDPMSAEAWADRIRPHLTRTVESILAAGRELIDAKADLEHGEWLRCLELTGVEQSAAWKLMAIGRHPVLTNPATLQHLPTTSAALYQLSHVKPPELTKAISAGKVTPALTVTAAKALRPTIGRQTKGDAKTTKRRERDKAKRLIAWAEEITRFSESLCGNPFDTFRDLDAGTRNEAIESLGALINNASTAILVLDVENARNPSDYIYSDTER